MKLVIASDIHGAAMWCQKLLDVVTAEQPDRLVLLGDILYHGPRNDLPTDYAPKEVIALLSPLAERIIAVRGNCEAEVDQMVLPFPCMSESSVLIDKNTTLFFTHGHIWGAGYHNSVDRMPRLSPGSWLFYGHTHIKVNELKDGIHVCNPGSVGIPKDGTHSCAVYEDGTLRFIEL